jgi:uncharacterized tellurite resistance protein B-like protein
MSSDLEQLQLAFAFHMVQELAGADAQLDQSELDWIRSTFPLARLKAAGLVDVTGRTTPLFDELRHRALGELPELLAPEQKLELVELIARASAADGVLAAEEADAIAAVARILEVPEDQWLGLLDGMVQSGLVERDATGW